MKNSLETRLGLFFALVFVAAFVLFEMVGGGRFFGSGIPIKARFNTAGDLKVGDPVKLAGVDIGRVAKATGTSVMMIQKHYQKFIPQDFVEKLSHVQMV